MIRIQAVLALLFSASVFACSSGGSTPTASDAGTTSAAQGDAASSSSSSSSSDLGPECTAYVDCCNALADSQPSIKSSCDQFQKSVESGQAQGVSPDQYEATCKSAVDSYKSAGYCK